MTTITHVRRRLAHAAARARLTALAADEFEGYASLFGIADGAGDVVAPGAFARSLRARPPARVRLLYQHFAHEPIGVWEEIREDSRGLFVRGRLTTDVQRGREVMALLRDGALGGLSIGFRTRRARRDPVTGHRILLELELWEISVVTFPLLANSHVTAIGGKAERLADTLHRATAQLRAPSTTPVIPGEPSHRRCEGEGRGSAAGLRPMDSRPSQGAPARPARRE